MYIHSFGSFVGQPVEDIAYYKQEVSRYTELRFRRANRFVLLSLAGACRCAQGHSLEKDTAVYLTTENGNLGDTETVLDQIFHQRQFPMPYNFINTMSNTASFYVAQNLNLFSRNLTLSSKQLSFERGIELLRSDFLNGSVRSALIGGVDEACFSKRQFEAKYPVSYEMFAMVEGSCWLLVKAAPAGAVGAIDDLKCFADIADASAWLRQRSFARRVVVSYGILVDAGERQAVAAALPNHAEFDHIGAIGYHDSVTASGAAAFCERFPASHWVHVNKDLRGQFAVMILDAY